MVGVLGTTSKQNLSGRAYGTKPVSVPSPSPRASEHNPLKSGLGASSAAQRGSADLEKEYIYNLQQQIYFLELEMKYMRENGGAPPTGGGAGAMGGARPSSAAPRTSMGMGGGGGGGGGYMAPLGDGSLEDALAQLRAQASDMEARQQQELAQAQARLDRAVQERMSAQMSESRAHDERRRAEGIVDKLRDEHTHAMSQLIGESVALQRQLEHRAVSEKTLRADVSALTEQLLELKKRFASYDVDMRELAERLAEATAACAKHDRDSIKQRAEVNELRTTAEHAEARATSLSALLAQRAGDASDAQAAKAKAEGESRLARLELEQTTDALAKLQDDCKFLIMENAQLQAASSSSAAAAALSEKERTRMLDELDRSKVERALTKFMFRKQRDKYLETAELHRETKEQIADNFRELARASQRYDDLERELRTARRRAAVKEDHYATQEADAAKLAQENRLLLERATQMGALIEQLRADLTVANKEGDEAKATAKILKDRDALARVLSNFRVDDFRSMMDQNREVAGHIQTLLGALAPAGGVAPAGGIAPPPAPST